MEALHVGTDSRTVVTSAPGPGEAWHQTAAPAGEQHAVRPGERVALCGTSPAILWHDLAFPRPGPTCPVCGLLSGSTP